MEKSSFSELLSGLQRGQGGRIETDIPDNWMQGRTTYGGLTTALCHESASALAENTPLRAVQVAFIGPVGGHVVMSPTVLRRGKSSMYVNVDVVSEKGIMARAMFTFGAARESAVRVNDLTMPSVPGPDQSRQYFERREGAPSFSQQFDVLPVMGGKPFSGSAERNLGLWLRHRGAEQHDTPTSILALADAPPPAAMIMMTTPAPTSSMTWMTEMIGTPPNPGGWYFAESVVESAGAGYSSQRMSLWTQDGHPVMIGRQTVAMFA